MKFTRLIFIVIGVTIFTVQLKNFVNNNETKKYLNRFSCHAPCLPMAITNLSQSLLEQYGTIGMTSIFVKPNSRLGPCMKTKYPHCRLSLLVILLLCGDIETNPGPRHRQASIFPCGICELRVSWSEHAICCDNCDIWFHRSCIDMGQDAFNSLANKSVSWSCYRCHSQNYSVIFHSSEVGVESSNRFSPLMNGSNTFLFPSPGPTFMPPKHSSPKSPDLRCQSTRHNCSLSAVSSIGQPNLSTCSSSVSQSPESPKSPVTCQSLSDKKRNWRTLIINCNRVSSKGCELSHLIHSTDPDALLLCETKLKATIQNSEFIPPSYTCYRKDRDENGGGVLVAIKACYPTESIEIEQDCEFVCASCHMRGNRKLFLASFYRPPDKGPEPLEELQQALEKIRDKIKNNQNAIIMLGGDFNAGDIDWETGKVFSYSNRKKLHGKLLDVLHETSLTQQQFSPTHGNNVLDLYCTNMPGLTKNISILPGIADHEIVAVDSDIRPLFNKKTPRKIFRYDKGDWTKIMRDTRAFRDEYCDMADDLSVDENWQKVKNHVLQMVEQYIPSKVSSTKFNLPWVTTTIKRLCRKKQRLYNKWKKSRKTRDFEAFSDLKKEVRKLIRKSHWEHVNKILSDGFERNDSKPFWRYVKAKRQERIGIAPLKVDGLLHNSAKDKAEILNKQFFSVFTPEVGDEIPSMGEELNSVPDIEGCVVRTEGVLKLLQDINVNKASGPDDIPCRMLKMISVDLAPCLTKLFNQSLSEGIVPEDWKKAKIAPVYKKGSIHAPSNYRPVSLTCVCCKLLEHIVSSHIRAHLDKYNILSPSQHGFRKRHSCETQLLITLQDLTLQWDRKKQVDVAVLDFAKAFDTVPHRKLLGKLTHYGITGNTYSWIQSFLSDRQQCVVVDGVASEWVPVVSGVPQGTVLGPLLFLLHINDLPTAVSSSVRLFADDCLLYREIKSAQDQVILQRDLVSLEEWGIKWGMRFNASKCNVLRITRSQAPITSMYSLCGEILQEVDETKYLGITISKDLSWSSHTQHVSHKASNILAFLRRNLQQCPAHMKELAYITLVRSVMEYAAATWDPYLEKDIAKLGAVPGWINARGDHPLPGAFPGGG